MNKTTKGLRTSDIELAEQCLKGNPKAERFLYEKFSTQMFRVCLRYAKDKASAEDLLQEGFIKVFRDLKQYNGKGPLGGWVRKVMINTALQYIRKQNRLFPTISLEDYTGPISESEEKAIENQDVRTIVRTLQQLPVGYRAVFNLYVIEGYSHQEIAEMLNININTSKSQLSKAKTKIRFLLKQNETKNVNLAL